MSTGREQHDNDDENDNDYDDEPDDVDDEEKIEGVVGESEAVQILKLKLELAREEKEKMALELQLVKEKGLSAQSNNYSGASNNDIRHNISKMPDSSIDVLAFFAVFELTCIFNGVDESKMVNLFPGVLNANAHKIYARLYVEQCRDYGVVKGEILKGFKLSPKSDLERFRTMKRSGNDSNVQFLSKLKDMHRYYLDSKSITTFESLSEDIIVEQLRSVLPAETVTFEDQRRVENADELAKLAYLFFF